MTADRVVVLDVGHGNCCVIHAGNEITIVDAPRGPPLFRYLDSWPRTKVTNLLVSHGDADHLAGAAALLTSRRHEVVKVYANPDPNRKTQAWHHFLEAVRISGPETTFYTSLSTTTPGYLFTGSLALEIVSPTPYLAYRGTAPRGLTANTLSAAVRIVRDGVGEVLLAADIDEVTLDQIVDRDNPPDLGARLLVFPHHGGHPGRSDSRQFAERLTRLVRPERVVFSIARGGRAKNPQPDIIAGVRAGAPDAHICCTQLSRHCQAEPSELTDGNQCAGTVEVHFSNGAIHPERSVHSAIIDARATTPLCR